MCIRDRRKTNIEVKTDTMVLAVTPEKRVHAVNEKDGYIVLEAASIVLCMGCRERTRGAISIPGARPAGVFTAGAAQRYLNIEGYMVGRRVVILGSGDIGLIMARRMTLEGAKVLACVEAVSYTHLNPGRASYNRVARGAVLPRKLKRQRRKRLWNPLDGVWDLSLIPI